MRFSTIFTVAFSAIALAVPSEKRNASPAANALPVPEGAPIMDANLNSKRTVNNEKRLLILDDVAETIAARLTDIVPTLVALNQFLDSDTIRDLNQIIDNGAKILDDQGTAAARNLLYQGNRILTEENTNTIIKLLQAVDPLIDAIGPLLQALGDLLSQLTAVLNGLANFFGIPPPPAPATAPAPAPKSP